MTLLPREMMMKKLSMKKLSTIAFMFAAAALLPAFCCSLVRAADPPAKESELPPVRTVDQIAHDIAENGKALSDVLPGTEVLFDASKRTEAAPKAMPLLKKMDSLLDEMGIIQPRVKERMQRAKLELTGMRALLNDPSAVESLKATAAGNDPALSVGASSWQFAVKFAQAGKDAAAQSKVLEEMSAFARQHRDEDMVAQVADLLSHQGSTPAVTDRAERIISDDLNGEMAKDISRSLVGRRKLRGLENKPLTIKGLTVQGNKFTSEDFKGKVILVDFWATWCGPCRAELPRVKKTYAEFHDKGLELIGVSCDNDGDELKEFLADNPDMPWPQLFDASNPGWHALAKSFGIDGIPTMFLIDKKGVVRSISARENFETMIPKLLAE
jgi:thiol-disulfide isomerase/thioredoxin